MTRLNLSNDIPGLLVSVRSAAEALTALEGGADVIDIKEPNRGSLGAADASTIRDVVRAVNGRAPVTAALGELVELAGNENVDRDLVLPEGVSLFKAGLAGCASARDWRADWKRLIVANAKVRPVAVVYADWRAARAPSPNDVVATAVEFGCLALLIDTWDKLAGSLFDHWPASDLRGFLAEVRSKNIAVVLAGSLMSESVSVATRLMPDLIAVRSAACNSGRVGRVCEGRVRELKQAIAAANLSAANANRLK